MSSEFFKKHGVRNLLLLESPEIVIAIQSPSNSAAQMEEKRQFYFEAGAKEFWRCDEYGNMRYYNPQRELERSELFPKFPGHIDIDADCSAGLR